MTAAPGSSAQAPQEPLAPARPRRRGPRLDRHPLDALLVWAVVLGYTVPLYGGSFVVPKGFRPITEETPSVGPVVQRLGLLGAVLILAVCVLVLVVHRDRARRLLSPVLLLVAAWGLGIAGLVAGGAEVSQRQVLVPAICLAFAVARPGAAAVRALGWATTALAASSLLLAVVRPDAVRYQLEASQQDDKFVWAHGILSGPFGSGNNLGLALAVGLPAVLLLGRRWVRALAVLVVLLALAWTFSRTSWFAAGAAVGVGAVIVLLPRLRRVAAVLAVAGTGLVALVLPLVTSSDTAFSNRGGFWEHGLGVWLERPWTGWGADYYARLARSDDNLGGFAYHAHNQGVHMLVTGGLLLFALVVAAAVRAAVVAVRLAGRGEPWAAMMLTALFVCATFEVPLGLVDRSMFFAWVLVPLCVALTTAHPPRAQVTHG